MQIADLIAALNPWWSEPLLRVARAQPRRRREFARLERALDPESSRATALIGPRQVGKSTLLYQLIDHLLDSGWPAGNVVYFDFKDDRLVRGAEIREVTEYIPKEAVPGHPRVLLLDEVTGAPRWALAVKRLVDSARRRKDPAWSRIIFTDSAAGVLREGSWESLQGRVEEVLITGLDFSEFLMFQGEPGEPPDEVLRKRPDALERYLSLGGFPEFVAAMDPPRIRRLLASDVTEKAIGRELLRPGVDMSRLRHLFACLVQDSGAIFSAEQRATDLAASDGERADARSVRAWLELLERAFLVCMLRPRDGGVARGRARGSRILKGRPKVYAEDHGFISAFAPYVDPMNVPDVRAKIFEAVVYRHLRTPSDTGEVRRLSYFRLNDDQDLDFVIDGPEGAIGIDVTSSVGITTERLQKKDRAARAAGLDRLLLIHAGREDREVGSTRILPMQPFLLNPTAFLGEPRS